MFNWSVATQHQKMGWFTRLCLCLYLFNLVHGVKVKVVMHSGEEDSKIEDEEPRTEAWDHGRKHGSGSAPKGHHKQHQQEEKPEYEEEKPEKVTEKAEKSSRQIHPNDMIFPLIYRQKHITSMFKFGENWYTWSTEKRTDGSKATNYYVCYEEPKHCDDVGWERTDTVPKCAFQIESLLPEDRACLNTFGAEPRTGSACDGGEQMKVSEMVRACGPRIRSLWRFFRVGRRPTDATKPADVNSLVCDDEEECYVTIEYRIHHDRITFSLHEPTRGQTFKSALKRDTVEDETKVTAATEAPHHIGHRSKKHRTAEQPETPSPKTNKKFHTKQKVKMEERGKGVLKEKNDSGYVSRRAVKNKIKVREDISEDMSE